MAQTPDDSSSAEAVTNPQQVYHGDRGSGSSEQEQAGARQIGQLLRQTREAKGFSIDEMSQRTRIRDIHLVSLEAGEVDKMPGNAFVAGFMRLYAKTLELADNPLMEQFLADFENHRQNLATEHFPPPTKSRQLPNSGIIIGGVVGLVILSFSYSHFNDSEDGSQQLPAAPPLKVGEMVPSSAQSSDGELEATKSVLHFGKQEAKPLTIERPTEAALPNAEEIPVTTAKKPEKSRQTITKKPVKVVKKPREVVKKTVAKIKKPQVIKPKTVIVPTKVKSRPIKPPPPVRKPAPVVKKPVRVVALAPADTIKPFKPKRMKPLKKKVNIRKDDSKLTPRKRILNRYPEPIVDKQALIPDSKRAVSLISRELVWIQIQGEDGEVLKDMVMQPDHVFRVPTGMQFYAILGNAGGVRLRIGSKRLPYLGEPGEVIQDLDLSAVSLLERASKR
jgi:cytoskeleton protein RodZ